MGRRTEDMQRGSLMNIKMPQANNVCGILYAVVLENYSLVTLTAWGPFSPSTISKETAAPSSRVL